MSDTDPDYSAFSALWRLALVAAERGVRVFHEPVSGRYFATSDGESSILHAVSLSACSCRVFARWGRCIHEAALRVTLDPLVLHGTSTAETHPAADPTGARGATDDDGPEAAGSPDPTDRTGDVRRGGDPEDAG